MGIEFATIGAAGNRPHHVGLNSSTVERDVGAVNYDYRLSRTEITTQQWFEFVQAYRPYYAGIPGDSAFTGTWIDYSPTSGYSYQPENAQRSVSVSWYMAARYCNWLCNDKGTTQAAFNAGAYDASTFATSATQQPVLDQRQHTPGARFWLPTQDEWIKGAFFDPNKFGADSPGYWRCPNRSDSLPIPGLPGMPGATSNVGLVTNSLMEVASYPNSQSPWGLFDISGGEKEWSETLFNPGFDRLRLVLGSVHGDALFSIYDVLDFEGGDLTDFNWPQASGVGIRIASVPAGGSGFAIFVGAFLVSRRRRP